MKGIEFQEVIINRYSKKESLKSIGLDYNISKNTVKLILEKNNIEIRSAGDTKRKYTLNEYYFDKINNAEKAYFLGFLYSDGTINNINGAISISLQMQDKYILERFSDLIGSNKKVKHVYNKTYDKYYAKFSIYSVYMCNSLINLGVFKNKTNILQFPTEEQVPKEFLSHFVRGVFDGDGCITINKKNQKTFSIIGLKSMMLDIQSLLISELNLTFTKFNSNENNFFGSIRYSGNRQINLIREWLYNESTIHLQRKFDKFYI